MNATLERQVWEPANGVCEYCYLPQATHPAPVLAINDPFAIAVREALIAEGAFESS